MGKDLEFKFDYKNRMGLPCSLSIEYKFDDTNTQPITASIRAKRGKQAKLEGMYSTIEVESLGGRCLQNWSEFSVLIIKEETIKAMVKFTFPRSTSRDL